MQVELQVCTKVLQTQCGRNVRERRDGLGLVGSLQLLQGMTQQTMFADRRVSGTNT
jgi:hypothetical protein